MSDAFTDYIRDRRFDIVDRLPDSIRQLVHEFDLPPVAHAMSRGARRPETVRRRAEAWLARIEERQNRRRST